MKRSLTGSALVALLLTVAYAPMGAAATTERAIVVSESGCGMLDGDGNFITGESHSVTNNGGNSIYKCQSKKVNNSSKSGQTWDRGNTGYMCGTPLGPTADWREIVTPSGNATLTCHARN